MEGGRRSQLLRGVLDLCLLAVMGEGPAYGYEMTKRLRARGLSIVGEGSIYPLLGRLERDGLGRDPTGSQQRGPTPEVLQPLA
jgi:PadR family transcriptional regulator PadR